jgi:hypothetical protein
VCNSSDEAAHYHTLGPKLGASSLTLTLGWSWSKLVVVVAVVVVVVQFGLATNTVFIYMYQVGSVAWKENGRSFFSFTILCILKISIIICNN